jgi:hypothetical protein
VCGAYLFVLSNDAQAGLWPAAVAVAAVRNRSKLSWCNVVWGSFPQAVGTGCQRFDSGWYFISTGWGKEKRRKEKRNEERKKKSLW